jgi:hypothetical protein
MKYFVFFGRETGAMQNLLRDRPHKKFGLIPGSEDQTIPVMFDFG